MHPFLTGFFPQPNSYKYQTKQTFLNMDFQPIKNLTVSAHHSIMSWDSRLSLYWEPETTVETRYSDMDLYGASEKNNLSSASAAYVFEIKKHNIYFGLTYSREEQSDPTTTYNSRIAELYGYENVSNSNETVMNEADTGWVSYLPQKRNQISLYVHDNWKISEKLAATIGLRYDYYDDLNENNILNPRLGLVWRAFEKSKFKFLYGQAFRPPSPSETSIILNPIKGNPNLKPEKIKTGEIAFIHYFGFARFQINGFYSVVEDPINLVPHGILYEGNLWDTFDNLGGAKMSGYEIELQAKYWWINYSYVNSQTDNGTGEYLTTPFMASHHVNAGVNYTFFDKFTINNQIFFKSKRPELNENQGDSEPYIVDDISVVYKYKFLNFKIACRNLFDNIWEMPLADGGIYTYPYRGREFFAQISVKINHNKNKDEK